MLAVKPEVITNFKKPTNATTANHTGLNETIIVLGRNMYCLEECSSYRNYIPSQFVKDYWKNWASWYSMIYPQSFAKGKSLCLHEGSCLSHFLLFELLLRLGEQHTDSCCYSKL